LNINAIAVAAEGKNCALDLDEILQFGQYARARNGELSKHFLMDGLHAVVPMETSGPPDAYRIAIPSVGDVQGLLLRTEPSSDNQ